MQHERNSCSTQRWGCHLAGFAGKKQRYSRQNGRRRRSANPITPAIKRCGFAFIVLVICAQRAHAGETMTQKHITRARQLLRVITPDWSSPHGELRRFQKKDGNVWTAVGRPVTVVVGKKGLGWGRGLHGHMDGPQKKEGDRKAPAGVFALGGVFGYADRENLGLKVDYRPATASLRCIDDPKSRYYNRIIDIKPPTKKDWTSSEKMLRKDHLYRWGMVVRHNTESPLPGAGSCIFLHLWRGRGKPTVGCTAFSENAMKDILTWLDPKANPILVQLPKKEYRRLAKPWRLPSNP